MTKDIREKHVVKKKRVTSPEGPLPVSIFWTIDAVAARHTGFLHPSNTDSLNPKAKGYSSIAASGQKPPQQDAQIENTDEGGEVVFQETTDNRNEAVNQQIKEEEADSSTNEGEKQILEEDLSFHSDVMEELTGMSAKSHGSNDHACIEQDERPAWDIMWDEGEWDKAAELTFACRDSDDDD